MSNYIPVRMFPDRMPVDISFVFEKERPAGKHGFAQVDGENIRFEDGTLGKFWGVLCNGASSFPEHDYAEKVTRRLAQAGCNVIRFHQLDSEWATPNFYRITAGRRIANTRELCPESFDRLDYLISCMKQQGIYAFVDMTTYRKFKTGDGVKFANEMKDNMKAYALYDPVMIDLQKEFCTKFWNHVNPYTGLAYKDDPVFVMCCITNENDLFKDFKVSRDYNHIPYYDDMFRDLFAAWLKEQGIDYDAYGCPLYNNDEPMLAFRIKLMKDYCETMYAHIRSLGVRIPLSGTNWPHGGGLIKAQETMDFQDSHSYFYDWRWGEYEKVTPSRNITASRTSPLAMPATSRITGQPMLMTEWDVPWPNSYRAEGPIWYPAVAAFQNWVGMSIHTYGYGTNFTQFDPLGKESISNTVGSVPFREGIFTVRNDPAKFGLFYHGALMLRRQDVSPAKVHIGSRLTTYAMGQSRVLTGTAMEIHQVSTVLDTTDTSSLQEVYDDTYAYPREDPDKIVSDTGELWRDLKRQIGAVDTPRTKSVYGFLGKCGSTGRRPDLAVRLNGMTVDCITDFATITISSLTDDPISKSENMLLSTVGRARNDGDEFDGEKLVKKGPGPIMAEVIDAYIELQTEKENLRVWAINSDGFYCGRVPAEYEDGWLKFHVGPHFPCTQYLIMEE